MSFRELHKRWEFDLKSSPERLWPFIADTNRFNRDTGVPEVEIDKAQKQLRNARRKLRLSVYGLPIEWEEQPFEWVRPKRFGIERVYSKGPMARLRVLAQLTPNADGGTHLVYQVWSTPRNLPGAFAISLQLGLIVARRFRDAILKYDAAASNGGSDEMTEPDTSRSLFDRARLASFRAKCRADLEQADMPAEKRALGDRLADFIEHADDFAARRI